MHCNEGKKKNSTTKPKNLARDDKYGAMSERATRPIKPGQQRPATQPPVCIKPPASDRTGKRSVSEAARDLIFPRALIEKDSKVETMLGNARTMWICSIGKYAPTADAKKIAEITKYWTFQDPADPDECTVEVGRVAQIDISANPKYEIKALRI